MSESDAGGLPCSATLTGVDLGANNSGGQTLACVPLPTTTNNPPTTNAFSDLSKLLLASLAVAALCSVVPLVSKKPPSNEPSDPHPKPSMIPPPPPQPPMQAPAVPVPPITVIQDSGIDVGPTEAVNTQQVALVGLQSEVDSNPIDLDQPVELWTGGTTLGEPGRPWGVKRRKKKGGKGKK